MVLDQLTDNDLLQKLSAIMVWVDSSKNNSVGSFCADRVNIEFAGLKKEILSRMAERSGQNSPEDENLIDTFLKAVVKIINKDSKTIQEKYWRIRREILERMKGEFLQKCKHSKRARMSKEK